MCGEARAVCVNIGCGRDVVEDDLNVGVRGCDSSQSCQDVFPARNGDYEYRSGMETVKCALHDFILTRVERVREGRDLDSNQLVQY